MKKRLFVLAMVFTLALSVTACGSDEKKVEKTSSSESKETEEKAEMMEFTLDELALYNGKDGAKAYVAVDGVVYDVTGLKAWTEGEHKGAMAGMDLTEMIQKAPHGTVKLEGLPVVGKLAQ